MNERPSIAEMFTSGLVRAIRPRTLLPLYVASLMLGIVQVWPVLSLVGDIGSRNLFLDELVQGGSRPYIDLFLGIPNGGTTTGFWIFGLLPASAVFGLLYNFFSGGMVGSWHATERRFWASSWRFFLTFVVVQMLLVMLASMIVVVTSATILGAPVVIAVVAATLLQLLNSLGEIARGYAVVADRRNPLVALGKAFAIAARQFPSFLFLTVAGVVLHGLLIALAWTLATTVPASPVSFVWQQLVLLVAIAIKVVRLSWATALAQGATVDYSSRNASAGDVRAMR